MLPAPCIINMKKIVVSFCLIVFFLCGSAVSAAAQRLKVEYVSGEVSKSTGNQNGTLPLKKSEWIAAGDRVYLGEKSLLVVSDASLYLFEVKKKGYITGKEIAEGLAKSTDNAYQRYLSYILKEIRSHETDIKTSDKGIPGAPSRGNQFSVSLPDTLYCFTNEFIPLTWVNGPLTEYTSLLITSENRAPLLDADLNGTAFLLNGLGAFFEKHKALNLYIYEKRSDGLKVQMAHTRIVQSPYEKTEMEKVFEAEFKALSDPRLNLVARAAKWEVNHYYLQALETYKILLLDYPGDALVMACYQRFSERTGFR